MDERLVARRGPACLSHRCDAVPPRIDRAMTERCMAWTRSPTRMVARGPRCDQRLHGAFISISRICREGDEVCEGRPISPWKTFVSFAIHLAGVGPACAG